MEALARALGVRAKWGTRSIAAFAAGPETQNQNNRCPAPPGNCRNERCAGDGENPGHHDVFSDAPAYRRKLVDRTDADNRSSDGMRG